MIPGEIETLEGDIEINQNRTLVTIVVCNAGDRPIQVLPDGTVTLMFELIVIGPADMALLPEAIE